MSYQQLVLDSIEKDYGFDLTHVTFKGGDKVPFRRWYPYLEGYSPEFVKKILAHFAPNAQVVLDPFGGTATTAFVASELGLTSYICEVNPLMQFIFDVKTRIQIAAPMKRREIYQCLTDVSENFACRLANVRADQGLSVAYYRSFGESQFFDKATFEQVLKARTVIDEISLSSPTVGDLVTIAVIASLLPCSYLKRAGDVRYKTEKELQAGLPSLSEEVQRKLQEIANDILYLEQRLKTTPVLICENATDLDLIPALQVDTLITSPPYINGTNYFRNTKVELWFLRCLQSNEDLRIYRSNAITAGINDVTTEKSSPSPHDSVEKVVQQLREKAYDVRIPLMVASYFAEMTKTFAHIRKHLVDGATVAIDIGDSIYSNVHVPADQLLIDCFADLGYSLQENIKLRERWSKNGAPLKQALLVFRYQASDQSNNIQSVPTWTEGWKQFQNTLPHQQIPYSKRNWGNALHSLCSYQGKLKPSIAHHLVKIFVPEHGVMLDPFAGVGTLPFEAALQGKKAYGFDLSPLAHIISYAKARISEAHVAATDILDTLDSYLKGYRLSTDNLHESGSFGFNKKLVDYYHPETLREIFAAKQFFQALDVTPLNMLVYASCLHLLHGNRPYALSRRSHPITPYAPSGEFEYRALMPRLKEKVFKSLETPIPDQFVPGTIFLQDATKFWPLEVNHLDAIITSPPFFDSTRFYLANWLRLWFTGWTQSDFGGKPLAFIDERQKESFEVYESVMRQARERLKPGGVFVLHLGESEKCDMAIELLRVSRKWFAYHEVFDESVAHCESHGIRDKGTVTSHQYLVLY